MGLGRTRAVALRGVARLRRRRRGARGARAAGLRDQRARRLRGQAVVRPHQGRGRDHRGACRSASGGSRSTSRRRGSRRSAPGSTSPSSSPSPPPWVSSRTHVVRDVVHVGEIGLDGTVRAGAGGAAARACGGARRGAARRRAGGQRRRGPARVAACGCTRWPTITELVRRYDALGKGRASSEVPVPAGRATATASRCATSARSSARPTPSSRSRSRPPVVTTCCWPGRPAPARRCSPSGCPDCCRRSTRTSRWRSRRSTRCSARSGPARTSRLITAATLRRAAPRGLAGRGHRGRQRAHPSRRHHPGPSRRPLPRRDAGVRQGRAPVAAHAAGARVGVDRPGPGDGDLPGALPARPGGQPMPCGNGWGKGLDCTCTPLMRRTYFGKLSGPLLDRVDLQVHVQPPGLSMAGARRASRRAAVAARVAAARTAQGERWRAVLGAHAAASTPTCRGRCCGLGRGGWPTAPRRRSTGRSRAGPSACAATTARCGARGPSPTSSGSSGPGASEVDLALSLRHRAGSGRMSARTARRCRRSPTTACGGAAWTLTGSRGQRCRGSRSRATRRCPARRRSWVRSRPCERIRAGRGTLARFAARLAALDTDARPRHRGEGRRPGRRARRRRVARRASTDRRARRGASGCAGRSTSPRPSSGPSRSSARALPRPTASRWPPTSRPAWPSGAGRSCRARPSASTAARTAAPWPSTAPRSPCWPAGWSGPTRRRTRPSSRGSPASGLVVSEVAPGSAPMKSRFLARNRLIAGMTRGTVVVEADLRSGSRNTVKHAIEAGRPVGAVPGPGHVDDLGRLPPGDPRRAGGARHRGRRGHRPRRRPRRRRLRAAPRAGPAGGRPAARSTRRCSRPCPFRSALDLDAWSSARSAHARSGPGGARPPRAARPRRASPPARWRKRPAAHASAEPLE